MYFVIEGCKVTALFSNYQIFLSEKDFFLRFIWSYRINSLYLQNQTTDNQIYKPNKHTIMNNIAAIGIFLSLIGIYLVRTKCLVLEKVDTV